MSTATERPTKPVMPVIEANIPDRIKRLKRWCCWLWNWNSKKYRGTGGWDKLPKRPSGKSAKCNDPSTWHTFSECFAAYQNGRFDGVGFMLGEDADEGATFSGVDCDDARDPQTGKLAPWAQYAVDVSDSYTEISPSGTGVKVLLTGKLPPGKRDNGAGLEVYDGKRFWTITGNHLAGTPRAINERPSQLADLHATFMGRPARRPTENPADERELALEALRNLSVFRASIYRDWVMVGMALHQIDPSDAMLAKWDRWSQSCPEKYEDGACARKWSTFNGAGGVGLGSLIHWAKQDSDFFPSGDGNARRRTRSISSSEDCEPISNAKAIEIAHEDGEAKLILVPLRIEEIKSIIRERTGNWPRRVGTALFVDDPKHGIAWIPNTDALFGWLAARTGIVKWHPKLTGAVSRGELFADLRRTVTRYSAVEQLPHEPPIKSHYYACSTLKPGDGKALLELLDRFSPATPIDRDLIQAMFATLLWGGDGGTRPAFVITSAHGLDGQGSGKSKLAAIVAHLYGGKIEISPNEDVASIKQRLLSDEAATRRIALIDNVKSLKFSWAELESLVTTDIISGKKLYVGEATRPNTLTWVVTLNGISLGADLAQRSVIIELTKPRYSATFEEQTRRFIDEYREKILSDVIAFLRSEPKALMKYSRWAAWEKDILSRLPDPREVQTVILERQAAADADADEASILEDFVRGQLVALQYNPDRDRVNIPVGVAARWFNWALNVKESVIGASRQLNDWCNRSGLKRLKINPSRTHGRGFVWIGDDADPTDCIAYDLQKRISQRKKEPAA